MVDLLNPYVLVIIFSLLIIISYFFNILSAKTSIPSVLMLIITGIGLAYVLDFLEVSTGNVLFDVLEILGIVGLIMIVLEAALDLHLTREKWPVIWKSFSVALISLILCSLAVAYILQTLFIESYTIALVYAVPLSIMSSAIVIPSVGELSDDKEEFMVYESTFSDILGIMYFYFLIGNLETENVQTVVFDVVLNILITIGLSVFLSYLLVFVFQRIKTEVKLFLLIAVLLLLYSLGKLFHLSSLIIILIFGLILNNHRLFFKGFLKQIIERSALHGVLKNFHLITIETAFVVRTFFFILFGMTIDLTKLQDVNIFFISVGIVIILVAIRFIFLRIIRGKDLMPEIMITPRGLITILLFFSIPANLQTDTFNEGILLYTILLTSILMAIGLIMKGKHIQPVESFKESYWEAIDEQIEAIPEDEKHKTIEEKVATEDNAD